MIVYLRILPAKYYFLCIIPSMKYTMGACFAFFQSNAENHVFWTTFVFVNEQFLNIFSHEFVWMFSLDGEHISYIWEDLIEKEIIEIEKSFTRTYHNISIRFVDFSFDSRNCSFYYELLFDVLNFRYFKKDQNKILYQSTIILKSILLHYKSDWFSLFSLITI